MDLERARIQLQIKKCDMTISELDFKILERLKDIERIKDLIDQQKAQAVKYEEELKGLN